MFTLASTKWKLRPDNPCRGIQRFQEHRRQRYLKPEELQRLLHSLAEHFNTQTANAIRLLLMTGARRSEVLSATWAEFDLERGEWIKPSAHTKRKTEHHVPLSAPALALLTAMKANHDQRKEPTHFVFPSRAGDTPQQELKRFWRRVCKDAGLTDVRVHDLRHSFASYLASSGASLPLIGALLGHTQAQTTARYAHLLDDPQRKPA
jgi:integrase